jgi:putative DNA primase/helicase
MPLDLRSIARALGGKVSRNQVLAPAMGHSRKDRSLSVRLDPRAPSGFLVHCFGSGDPLIEKDRIRELLGLRSDARSVPARPAPPEPNAAGRAAQALAIWRESYEPWETPVERYLTRPREEGGRAVQFPSEAAGAAIRYHPECPFSGKRTPAMVCLVRDVRTNEPKAIHRIALNASGAKIEVNGKDRLALGPIAGGAIKLTPDEDVALCLGVAEGVETALSLRNLPEFGLSPVWSLISAGNLGKLPALPGIESLWIAVDNDPSGTGQRESRKCARRWVATGREAFLVTPSDPGADLNDLAIGVQHHV